MPEQPVDDTASGPGRVLVGIYGIFTLAAGARAAVQIATDFSAAPLADACVLCDAGFYNPVNGSTGCLPCPMTTFQQSNGQSACQACAPGYDHGIT